MMIADRFAYDGLPEANRLAHNPFVEFRRFKGNCTTLFLEKNIETGCGDNIALISENHSFTYFQLLELVNQAAHELTNIYGIQSGNRVLLRGYNSAAFAVYWLAIARIGAIAVATMPLLRKKELEVIAEMAAVSLMICEDELASELDSFSKNENTKLLLFNRSDFNVTLKKYNFSTNFQPFIASEELLALIGFTSGTTGKPKMTAHYHSDVAAICEGFPKYSLKPKRGEIFAGSPPLGFTFGLGGLLLFPLYYGATSLLIPKPAPEVLLQAIEEQGVTTCFTAPTAWRVMCEKAADYNIDTLKYCVSAGEALSAKVAKDWEEVTGIPILDGIGATEMLHIFIGSSHEKRKIGFTGVPIPGYEATLFDDFGNEIQEINKAGRLAVRGITGCKYLFNTEKQDAYVQNGWNFTGDIYQKDADGFFQFVARGDDMIISSGYNIAAIEVEQVLLEHELIKECAVVGKPDENRGMLVAAYVVLHESVSGNDELKIQIQNWFKEHAAPYKYPRHIEFVATLPKTETGKIQRFKLRTS
ncbi:AMP-binding protein [Flavobacterium aurantiibacter]|uniref:2-aminobenzoate-CoA ligase n=1 Tax=Flavobacterium aurantiibacter TaxID=2023067 RepID=A0A255ZSA4_9FLAO|nr:AMP-binding protein [Flavobacterium aurantiibacter]OYQ43600.1 2-aminobenzoate-CoA ligase [Flavobacterium aurantiibacter]